MDYQYTSYETWVSKYQLKDAKGKPIDKTMEDTLKRVSRALASMEKDPDFWEKEFLAVVKRGATPAGRIMANAGAGIQKTSTSLINCTVSQIVEDSIKGILEANLKAGMTLSAGCGIGYEFSTLRPRGAYVHGAGASTSGSISFMEIFNAMCFTIASSGGRRGAQMATFRVWHPDVEAYIDAKRSNGAFRQFNMSLLIDNEFMEAVLNDTDYDLVFPIKERDLPDADRVVKKKRPWNIDYCKKENYVITENDEILCKVYKTVKASQLWDKIMRSTYDYAEPGFLLIDEINYMNPLHAIEEIGSTNPCGEQPLPPNGACLLGSLIATSYIKNPLRPDMFFDWDQFEKDIRIFSRMLDNVVEINGLPLQEQRDEITSKRRHGMGITGIGSSISILGYKYGSEESIEFVDRLFKTLAVTGMEEGILLAKEKGMAPVLKDKNILQSWVDSPYMQKIWEVKPELREEALQYGCRYTHATSVAPTGTMSLVWGNNVSNGIEPTFTHKYIRNIIKEGKKAKIAETVYSYEALLYKEVTGSDEIPEFWSTSDSISPMDHLAIQATAQKWVDSAISKTINVPSNYPYESFKDIYLNAYKKRLKGCTTYRFNPEAFSGVLVKSEDLESTSYVFVLDDGTNINTKGSDIVTYEGESYTAQNLFDAIKEGYYGKL